MALKAEIAVQARLEVRTSALEAADSDWACRLAAMEVHKWAAVVDKAAE